MGLYCQVDVVSDWGFPTQTWYKRNPINYSDIIQNYCSQIYDEMVATVPVDTGFLRSTLSYTASSYSFQFETDCEYAQYVEYGTYCQSPQPYFTPAIQKFITLMFNEMAELYNQMAQEDFYQEFNDRAEQEGLWEQEAGFEDTGQANTGPTMPMSFGGYNVDITGTILPSDWQTTQPQMWREGTTMRKVAEKRQNEWTQYFDRRTHKLKAPYMKQFKQTQAKALAPRKNSKTMIERDAIELNISLGALLGATLILNGADIFSACFAGLLATFYSSLIALTIINAFIFEDIDDTEIAFVMPDIIIT